MATSPKDRAAHYLPWPVDVVSLPQTVYRDPAALPVRVLCVGKLAQTRKRQDALIKALVPLAGQVELTLSGATDRNISGADEAHFAALQDAAARYDWVTIRENVPFEDMPALFASHHICVLPSSNEPLGVAPLEAMAYGTIPVIAQDAGSAGYLTPGRDGVRVDMAVAGALHEALANLVARPDLRQTLSDGAKHTAQTELSPQRFLARIDALLP